MKLRKITAMTMLISFVLLVVTSIILYIVPHGRVAYWSDWRLWGLSKTQWGNLHINLGFLFLLAGLLHIFYNWNPIVAYMKNRARQVKIFTPSFNVALALAVVVSVGTLAEIPPMSTIIDFGESIKEAAAEKYGEPPYGHAELSSLKMFAKKTGLDLERARQLLDEAGIRYTGTRETIADIARNNNLTPKALYAIIQPAEIHEEGTAFPDSPPSGFGRRVLADICAEYNLRIPDVLRALKAKGIEADPAKTIKELAADAGEAPMTLFEIIHAVATGT